jgi:hypothetical protein
MENIFAASGIKVVDANDVAILFDQALTQEASQESCTTGNENSRFRAKTHVLSPSMDSGPIANSDYVDREDAASGRSDVTQFALAHSMES